MSPLQLIVLAAMLLLTAAVIAVAALRPAPPRLDAALAQLNAHPRTSSTTLPPQTARRWLPDSVVAVAERHLGATEQDLAILGRDRVDLAAAKIGWAAGGALTPALFAAILALGGVTVPATITLIASIGLAALAWTNPSRQVAEDAAAAREEFRSALAAFLALVGLERRARGSPAEALEEASRVSGSRPFAMIHTQVLRAELAAQPPWDGLRDLGQRIGVEELVNLADIVSTAADGAAVFDTLMAEARSMRHAEANAQHEKAANANERLVYPTICLFLCFAALLVFPAAVRLTGAG